MTHWIQALTIRTRIVLLVLAIVLPVAATLGWFLYAEVQHARDSAYAKVTILADHAADDLGHLLQRSGQIMAALAERPLVKALDPARCDPSVAEYIHLDPDFGALSIRDLQGRLVCPAATGPTPPQAVPDAAWFDEALQLDGLHAGNARLQAQSGRWEAVLTRPVRDAAGQVGGLLVLPLDLLNLNSQLLTAAPKQAVVTVVDRERAVLFRSAEPGAHIGTRPQPDDPDPTQGRRAGTLRTVGRDGVPRLVAFRTLPVFDWQVAASLPEAEVFADYELTLRRTLGIGAAVMLLAAVLAWRLSAAVARPIAELAGTAADVAAGRSATRAHVGGAAEVGYVAQQFNRALDAREASEAARAESEARYRTLVDWSPEALSVHVDGTVRFVNRACVDLLGAQSADELLGKPSIDFVHPQLQSQTQAVVDDSLEHGRDVSRLEQTFVKADGSSVDVEVHGTPILYEGRRAMLASMRDITARKRDQLALATSEAQLRGIFEAAPVAILTVDESQTVVQANPAAAATFRCAVESLVGAPLDDLIPPRYREIHRHDVRAFGESGHGARAMGGSLAVTGLRSNGDEFPIDAAISQLSVGGRRLYTVILRDTTERQQAEAALRRSEASLRQLLVMLPEPVFVSTGGRIGFANEAAERLFGLDEAGLLGRSPMELIHPTSADLVRARMDALRAGTTIAPLKEVTIVRADGRTRTVESTATGVEDHGEQSIVVVMRDVTELSEARRALAESHADLQRLVAVQDQVQEDERQRIARELHDDLQQTLAAVKIDLLTIGQRLPAGAGDLAPLLAETADLAATAIDSTRRIINDLRPQMLEDLGFVPALETLLAQFSRRTGIDCRVRVDQADSLEVPIPPAVATCLYRVTQEALNNAARHAHASKLRVRFAAAADGAITLRITDNGQGMVTGQRRKPESFGLLGMHERVRALGAALRIDSRPGAGTTIEVLVPADAGAAAWLGAARPIGPAGVHERADNGAAVGPLPGIIDALDGNIAVLDRQGEILFVNRAWREFAERNGAPDLHACGPGINYLDVCRRSAIIEPSAEPVLQGLGAVLEGRRTAFTFEYPCDTPDARLWYRMRAAPMDERHVLVAHVVLSEDPVAGGPGTARAPAH